MRKGSLFFLAGVASLLMFKELPPLSSLAALPLLGLCAFRYRLFVQPFIFLCGLCWALFRADLVLQDTLDPQLEGKLLLVEGVISDLPVQQKGGVRFILKTYKLKDASGREYIFPDKIRLHWFKSKEKLVPGERWQLMVKLKRPSGFANPGSFDYEAWLFLQGIGANGYVLSGEKNKLNQPGVSEFLHRLRYHLREKLILSLADMRNKALVPALVVGDRGAMNSEQWRVLTATGTSHLLAISGLHVGLVAGMAFFLARWLWPLGCITALLVPSPRIAVYLALLSAIAYAALAGFSVPTQRALIMLVLFFSVTLASRKTSASMVCAVTLVLVLIIDPFAFLSAGFWLSFSAVLIILYGMSCRVLTTGLWWQWGRVQFLVALGLLPVLVFWFQQVPVLSALANLVVVPWVSFVTVPLVLTGSLFLYLYEPLGAFILNLGQESINLFWPFLNLLADSGSALYSFQRSDFAALCLAFTGGLLVLSPAGIPARYIALLWFFPLFFPSKTPLAEGEFRFTLLDVGQGLAAFVGTNNYNLVFDTGPRFSPVLDAGSAVLIPYLRRQGVRSVDMLVLSHGDNDHIGGLSKLLEQFNIRQILSSVPEHVAHANSKPCLRGQTWIWDGVTFEILHPEAEDLLSRNNLSCVLKVSNGKYSILLTGDIEKKAELRLLTREKQGLKSTILVAPHHGSRTSSTRSFVNTVSPEYVLFANGYRNRFGFPKQDIIARYRQHDAVILSTARHGALEFTLGKGTLSYRSYREHARRLWNRRSIIENQQE